MNTDIGLERCFSFINCQMNPPRAAILEERRPAITLSRQAGAGAHAIAERLLNLMQERSPREGCPWAIFDRNLVDKVLERHQMPSSLARFMPEDRISELSDTMDELFGLHPPSPILVRKVSETILHLAELGNVIIIGRGAHIITAQLPHVFHVRLVGSMERRLKRVQEMRQLPPGKALESIEQEDLGRRRYLKKYFGRDIDDPTLYHLTINTDLMEDEECARLIADTVMSRGWPARRTATALSPA